MMNIKNKKLFARGKRGIIYTAFHNGKKIAIKTKRPDSKAVGRIKNEAKWMKLLNRHKIGPKFVFFKHDELAYEFVDGNFILDYFKKATKKSIINVVKDIFKQLYQMDKLKVNKLEMHHPVKHIVVKNKKPVMLDFERCYKTKKPKNITQFCQFLISTNVSIILKGKGINIDRKNIIKSAKEYKKDLSLKSFNRIISIVTENNKIKNFEKVFFRS